MHSSSKRRRGQVVFQVEHLGRSITNIPCSRFHFSSSELYCLRLQPHTTCSNACRGYLYFGNTLSEPQNDNGLWWLSFVSGELVSFILIDLWLCGCISLKTNPCFSCHFEFLSLFTATSSRILHLLWTLQQRTQFKQ